MINNRQNGRRRGRGGGQRSPNPGNSGNRQDNRQRGNAAQLHEKYKAMARDAQLSGDRVQTEYYLQFADHYFRILNEGRARFEEQRRQRGDFSEDEEYQDEGYAAQDQDGSDEGEGQFNAPPQRDRRPVVADRDEETEGEGQFAGQQQQRRERRPAVERGQDGGEGRRERPRFRPREVRSEEQDAGEERISLDVLPPAISPVSNDAADASEAVEELPRAPRRRTRRPRAEPGEEIAPAA